MQIRTIIQQSCTRYSCKSTLSAVWASRPPTSWGWQCMRHPWLQLSSSHPGTAITGCFKTLLNFFLMLKIWRKVDDFSPFFYGFVCRSLWWACFVSWKSLWRIGSGLDFKYQNSLFSEGLFYFLCITYSNSWYLFSQALLAWTWRRPPAGSVTPWSPPSPTPWSLCTTRKPPSTTELALGRILSFFLLFLPRLFPILFLALAFALLLYLFHNCWLFAGVE